ncbi:MAG: UDP-N-acetylglucosamine--N-acetylmuramyl-(pentapeptide) pyrophosphoryl-undecaprenol N-acetylglucosamine transferase [Candidatus Omnitrophica bacterium]|nr:UDP-N-acetylglucosamine--N-acetylmuramyl-(pentapeptide) pyrophosphoryl-undecaprenol N-acetylglucosamine transferase [Candidatus Omnitrophota bacterium]
MKIVLACGGSGGHIFPAFSVAEELKKRRPDCRIVYVCGNKGIEREIFRPLENEKVISIASAPFLGRRSLWDARFLIKLAAGILGSARALGAEKPDVVVGFGGYFSFPVVLTARLMGVRTLIHEQNVVPGVANRFLSRWTDGTALSFAETKGALPKKAKDVRVTGNPIRASIEKGNREEALGYFGFDAGKMTLLLLGGSQGAESINALFFRALKFLPEDWRGRVQILHLSGKMPPFESEKTCRDAGMNCRAYAFFERMDLAYAAADLALGRSGATFLAEIAAKKIPAILVPYPHGNGHQKVNARVFSRTHDAAVLDELKIDPKKLAELLAQYFQKITEKKNNGWPPGDHPAADSSRSRLANFIEELAS